METNGGTMTHTHTPKYRAHEGIDYLHIYGPGHDHSGNPFAVVRDRQSADRIVNVLNSHDVLLAALEECITEPDGACFREPRYMERRINMITSIARAAIADAKGSEHGLPK